jgi:hypothetical protein
MKQPGIAVHCGRGGLFHRMSANAAKTDANTWFQALEHRSQTAGVLRVNRRLSAEAEIIDDGAVPLNIVVPHIIEQAAAAADQHQQPATRMVILLVDLQVLGEVLNAMGKQADLDLGAAGVAVMKFKLVDQTLFFLHRKNHGVFPPFCADSAISQLKTQQ